MVGDLEGGIEMRFTAELGTFVDGMAEDAGRWRQKAGFGIVPLAGMERQR